MGDVAWGGNWFFLVQEHDEIIDLANVERLTDVTWRIRQALQAQSITGDGGGEIDHIELFGPPTPGKADSKNFVLCPGKAYDRSPCGTGTSAKLACLAADGKLAPAPSGGRRASSAASSRVRTASKATRSCRGSGARLTSTPRPPCSSTPHDPFAWGIGS